MPAARRATHRTRTRRVRTRRTTPARIHTRRLRLRRRHRRSRTRIHNRTSSSKYPTTTTTRRRRQCRCQCRKSGRRPVRDRSSSSRTHSCAHRRARDRGRHPRRARTCARANARHLAARPASPHGRHRLAGQACGARASLVPLRAGLRRHRRGLTIPRVCHPAAPPAATLAHRRSKAARANWATRTTRLTTATWTTILAETGERNHHRAALRQPQQQQQLQQLPLPVLLPPPPLLHPLAIGAPTVRTTRGTAM